MSDEPGRSLLDVRRCGILLSSAGGGNEQTKVNMETLLKGLSRSVGYIHSPRTGRLVVYACFHAFHGSSVRNICLLVEHGLDGFLLAPPDVVIIGFHIEAAIAVLALLQLRTGGSTKRPCAEYRRFLFRLRFWLCSSRLGRRLGLKSKQSELNQK